MAESEGRLQGAVGRFRRQIEILAALATIVALGIAIMQWRTHPRKVLEVTYIAKLSLVNPAGASEKVRVTYDGQYVKNLTKLSARVSNIGDTPIEKRDIEEPLVFTLQSGAVLAAEIVSTQPSGLRVGKTHDPRSVRLDHGLLNPGDSIALEILTDGDPGWPSASARVSGVQALSVTIPSTDGTGPPRIAWFRLSRQTEYSILTISSVAVVGMLVVSAVAMREILLSAIFPMVFYRGKINQAFREAESFPPSEVQTKLAERLWMLLPSGVDNAVRDTITSLKAIPGETTAGFLERVRRELRSFKNLLQRLRRVKIVDTLIFVAIVAAAVSCGLIVAGAW